MYIVQGAMINRSRAVVEWHVMGRQLSNVLHEGRHLNLHCTSHKNVNEACRVQTRCLDLGRRAQEARASCAPDLRCVSNAAGGVRGIATLRL